MHLNKPSGRGRVTNRDADKRRSEQQQQHQRQHQQEAIRQRSLSPHTTSKYADISVPPSSASSSSYIGKRIASHEQYASGYHSASSHEEDYSSNTYTDRPSSLSG